MTRRLILGTRENRKDAVVKVFGTCPGYTKKHVCEIILQPVNTFSEGLPEMPIMSGFNSIHSQCLTRQIWLNRLYAEPKGTSLKVLKSTLG